MARRNVDADLSDPFLPSHEQRRRLESLAGGSALRTAAQARDFAYGGQILALLRVWRARCGEADVARLCVGVVQNLLEILVAASSSADTEGGNNLCGKGISDDGPGTR